MNEMKFGSAEAFNSYFINRVKSNLHLILSFSPTEHSFRCVCLKNFLKKL